MSDASPPRRSLFAVWRWPKWIWVVVLILTSITYLLSPTPALYLMLKLNPPRAVWAVEEIVMLPAWLIREETDVFRAVDQFENDLLVSYFGEWNLKPVTPQSK